MACHGEKCGIAAFACNREVMRFISSAKSFAPVDAPLTPDHAVYCGARMLFIPAAKNIENQRHRIISAIRAFRHQYHDGPRVIAVEKLGMFCCGPDKKQAETALSLFTDSLSVAVYAESFGGVRPLSVPQIRHICGWEAESYRKRVTFGLTGGRRLEGRVAVVTGAAQGFGKGLAEALSREGAHVVVADRNFPLAQKTAGGLEGAPDGRAAALPVDVADSESVRRLVRDVALLFGGVDIFVSNAGVLKAGSLESFPATDFELVTRVNYTGYYFCVKHVSALMKLQHEAAPGHAMDIIQINSKSGLSGSRANFAYAGGKFGGIGLTQSFALELVDWNIKVNAICPGNLFDGPLWSDPETGLFVQYLRAKKVPGAKTVGDVRRFYEAKAPMKRGCTVEDVARALLYVIDQKYETGQALPVTGGQCMLS
jgi:NAD(P)-dependent dehydrogenase (short-subunit alcohol dehydrogenase family)